MNTLYRDRDRRRRTLGLALSVAVSLMVLSGCSWDKDTNEPLITAEPSRSDLIQAVRNSVRGKTYTMEVPEQRAVQHTCSQVDVDLDIHAKHNPELARCPHVGATYQTQETVYVSQLQPCQEPSGSDDSWSVNEMGEDTWHVSQAGRVWIVRKIEGSSANIGDIVRVSGFAFAIEPQQAC